MKIVKDYKCSMQISCTQEDAFKAVLSNIEKWWSVVEGETNVVEEEFIVSFGKESYWRFKLEVAKEYSTIIWRCIESHQDHHLKGMDEEWENTRLHWSFKTIGDELELSFHHENLINTGICYEVCSRGWDFYILDSLKSFLETGVGKPS